MKNEATEVSINDVLARCNWFEGLPPQAIEQIAAQARVKYYTPNSYLYRIGEQSRDIFGLLGGRVRMTIRRGDSNEFGITDLLSEAWIGEGSLLGDEPRVLEAKVIEGCNIIVIPRTCVIAVAEQYPIVYRNLFAETVKRSRATYLILGGALFLSLRERLAELVLQLVEECGVENEEGILMDLHFSQNDFAHLSMGSRQHINKIFREWSSNGMMEIKGDQYLIMDIDRLKQEVSLEEFA